MRDLSTMLWKETLELFGHRRFLLVFTAAILLMGILPTIALSKNHGGAVLVNPVVTAMFRSMYVLFATAIVVAQTAPDTVLHERIGHTLDYLLTTRLSNRAIFGAKVLISAAMGYAAAMLAVVVQLVAASLIGRTGWHWYYLGLPMGRVTVFGITAALSLYVAVIGTFVALRVGDQRAAYMVSIFAVALLVVPFFTGWIHLAFTAVWATHAALIFGGVAVVLGLIGLVAFRRDMLVLYLRD